MHDILNFPLFPLEELSPETFVKLPKIPHAESRSVKLYIILAEPHLFLEGFTKAEVLSRPPAILRGCLFLRVLQPVKIKDIDLKLKGISRTEWPEGIPPKKVEHSESKGLINHTWPFFNFQNSYPISANSRNNADLFIPKSDSDVSNFSLDNNLSPVTSNDLKPVMSPVSLLKSFRNTSNTISSISSSSDLQNSISNSGSDDNKYFPPGDYIYSFELPIQSSLPESVCVTFGSISYSLEAHVERSGAFKSSLTARRPLNIVRAPFENSSEENEPIIIDRDWENRLQYDIVIYSKQVILNSYLPISFRMIPLEKIKVHRLRVYITEHLEYYCHNKKVHRTEPPKKILLLEHKPPKDCDNLLALGNDEIGGVELDFQVFIPEYYNEKFHLHPDTTSEDVQSHHWIKICIRISKSEPTPEDPNKRKQYELSIDSPMHILSSHCVHANTLLPSYDEQIRLDCLTNNTETTSNKTLTPKFSPNPKQSFDKMMSPRNDTILDSNMFKPDKSFPIEMLSPQAKPFSPVASPQLNAINPELRENPMIRSLDLSPIISPLPGVNNRSRSTSRVTLRNRNISPIPRSLSSVKASSIINEPPPPPFIENPPTYAEATHSKKSNNHNINKRSVSNRRETTNSTISTESSNSGNSGSSALSFSAKHKDSNASNTPTPTPSSNTGNSNNPTRISLNLGGMNGSNIQLPRLGSGLIHSGTGTTSSTTPDESTPSISSFLNSPHSNTIAEFESSGFTNQAPIVRGRTKEARGNIEESKISNTNNNRNNSNNIDDSSDLAADTDLRFKITPIRSSSVSPYQRTTVQQHQHQLTAQSTIVNTGSPKRSSSHIRSASPIPIVAIDRNLNKLVNSSFMPGFSVEEDSSSTKKKITNDLSKIPLINPKINITNDSRSGSEKSPVNLSPKLNDRSSLDFSGVDRPLIPTLSGNTEDGNFSDSSNDEYNSNNSNNNTGDSRLSDNYHLHSNTLGSLNSLDLVLTNNRSQNTLNTLAENSYNTRNGSIIRGVSLNYLGNNMDNFEDGMDITNMGKGFGFNSTTGWNKLRNPKLSHPEEK
ncbi:hypothetical protein C6P42_005306 [Pichia californica]|nr:hypothetical protein C6P42_005306 [[Candida] californica]